MKLPWVWVTLFLILVFALPGFVPVVQGVQQTNLDSWGKAYEVNRDSLGNIYVSDADAYKIWVVNASNGTYKTYSFSRGVRDAQIDNLGRIWWADGGDTFGYVDPGTNKVYSWTLTAAGPYSLQALYRDTQGGVWLGESDGVRLFHYSFNSRKLCSYSFDELGVYTHDILYQAGDLWVGQWNAGGIYRVTPSADFLSLTYEYWGKGYDAGPWGIYLDGSNLWWAEYYLYSIVRLDTDQNLATFYTLPTGVSPKMLTLDNGKIWYTEENGQVGALDPSSASGSDEYLSTDYSDPIYGECSTLGAGSISTAQTSSGSLSWSDSYANVVYDQDGWKIFELEGGASPYGLAVSGDRVYVSDQNRKLLLRFDIKTSIYLPLVRRN